MKSNIIIFILLFVLIGCTSDNFVNRKDLHKKFNQVIPFDNITYGLSSSYKNSVSYKYVTINFEVDSNFNDKFKDQKSIAKKLAQLALSHYESESEYDGFIIEFKHKKENKIKFSKDFKFSFEELGKLNT